MKNSNLFLLVTAAAAALASCNNHASYTIDGTVADSTLNGNLIYLTDMASRDVLDSAVITDNKFLKRFSESELSQLLQTAISEGQSTYTLLSAQNEQIKAMQTVASLLCLAFGALVVYSVLRLLDPVQQMIVASRAIGQGDFDTPDVVVAQAGDEIGQLAGAFNWMKHSMDRQVKTLQEKNEIERQLHRRETEALELQNTVERARLQHLRSQIDPHFLFNTLGVILRVSDEEKAPRTRTR